MKKILSLLFTCLALAITAKAQSVAINTTGATANSTSILDISSISKGMLIPRMSAVQRAAIGTPANGLLVYDNDSLAFAYYNGVAWSFIKGNNNIAAAWSTKGNAGTTAANFLGTTDNQDVFFKRNNVNAGLLSISNTAFGTDAFLTNAGNFNAAFGAGALNKNLASGGYNTAIGWIALNDNTSGNFNTATGSSALEHNNTGNDNTAMGSTALFNNTTGDGNTANGYRAMHDNTTGYSNVAIGIDALYKNTIRSNLVAIGDSALYNNGTGASGTLQATQNTAIGSKALYSNTTGYSNVAIGTRAGFTNVAGFNNIAIGALALENNAAERNIAIGTGALRNLSGGFGSNNRNLVMGDSAALNLTSAYLNVIIGHNAFFKSSSSFFNTIVGPEAMNNSTDGQSNTAIGTSSLRTSNGDYNVALGQSAGNTDSLGYYNTYIGTNSNSLTGYLTNATAIGSNAQVSASNCIVLGRINGINGSLTDTKIGIGVTAPSEKLEIGNGRLRFRGNAPGGNAHGITWTNNAGTTDRVFIGMETDDLFGIYNFGFATGWNVRIHNTTGEMGINKQPGTTALESRLQVKQTSVGANRGIGIETAINTNRWDMWVDNNTGPDYNFSYNGSLRGYIQNATGNYIVVSDKRFKKDVTDFAGSLANINQLKTYQYHYLDNSVTEPFSIGFMAQDVQKLFPDAVSEKMMDDGKKRLGVNYQYFTVLAIKGLQEQQANMETQDKKIEALETQIAELKKLVEEHIKK